MELNHVNGTSVKTEELNDLDAQLMEECNNLNKLFGKYNRQLFVLGEMKATKETSADQGCLFYHVGQKDDSPELVNTNVKRYIRRIDGFLRTFTGGQFFVTRAPLPEQPPTSSQL